MPKTRRRKRKVKREKVKRPFVKAVTKKRNGKIVLNMAATAADVDWLHASRLYHAAKNGDEKAKKEYERMINERMVY